MLPQPELDNARLPFERAWASHAKNYAGLEAPLLELEAGIKRYRTVGGYSHDATDTAWKGFLLAYKPSAPPTIPDFVGSLSREQLDTCLHLARSRKQELDQQAKTRVWCVAVDQVTRFVATDPVEASAWLSELIRLQTKDPNTSLLKSAEPFRLKTERILPEELGEWLACNCPVSEYKEW